LATAPAILQLACDDESYEDAQQTNNTRCATNMAPAPGQKPGSTRNALQALLFVVDQQETAATALECMASTPNETFVEGLQLLVVWAMISSKAQWQLQVTLHAVLQ
jgi:hypothetical protein